MGVVNEKRNLVSSKTDSKRTDLKCFILILRLIISERENYEISA